jgi:hypothetical protein
MVPLTHNCKNLATEGRMSLKVSGGNTTMTSLRQLGRNSKMNNVNTTKLPRGGARRKSKFCQTNKKRKSQCPWRSTKLYKPTETVEDWYGYDEKLSRIPIRFEKT